MYKYVLRVFALVSLVAFPVASALAQGTPGTFRVSSVIGDDVPGGIFNGSPVNLTVTIKNASTFSAPYQAAVTIPAGYTFVDPKPCGGTVQTIPACRGASTNATTLNYLLYPDGTDVNHTGVGDDLPAGGTTTCTIKLQATTVTPNDSATVAVYAAPHNRCGTNSTDSQNYAFATTQVPTTDVSIGIAASKTSVNVGDTVDFTLTASNLGRQDAPNTRTTFTFPSSLSMAVQSCTGATGSGPITWSLSNIPYGTSATCVLRGTALSGAGTQATVSAVTNLNANETDTNTTNNSTSKTISIAAAASADLNATISANKTTLMSGDSVTLTLRAANAGPSDATTTQFTATFPAQLTLTNATCASGSLSSPLTWNIGTLAAGANATCTVQATLNTTSATSITANGSVTSGVPDPNTTDNSGSVTLTVQQVNTQPANLAIHLGGLTPGHTYAPGEALHIGVTANNISLGMSASNVTVTVQLPNDSGLTGLTAPCGAFDGSNKLTWSIPSIIAGGAQTCTISATVAGGPRTIPVSARISAPSLGSDIDQLMDALLVPVNPLPKQISKTITGAPTTGTSANVKLSSDGKTAVFASNDPNLIAGDANGPPGSDIYRVGADGKAVLETINSSGQQITAGANAPAISGDGSIVAFAVAGVGFSAKAEKIDITGQMWAGAAGQPKHVVDMGMGGAPSNGMSSGAPSVSSTITGGKKLVFCSSASNLVAGDTNGGRDIFLVDPTNPSQPTQRVSTDANGQELPGDSCEPALSADGTKVVFTISAPTLYRSGARQVVRKDLVTGALDLITQSTTPGGPGAGADSSEPTINADGSVIAFTSAASDFDSLGTPVGGKEVFVSLAQTGTDAAQRIIRRVRSSDGTVPNGASQHAQVSDDGNVLVMQTFATNFFGVGKADSGTAACGTVAITTNFFAPAAVGSSLCGGSTSNQNPSISGDGTTVAFDSNAPQGSSGSTNSNAWTQTIAGLNSLGKSAFDSDFSGQWFDPNQSGHGLVVDVLPPQSNGDHLMSVIWFVYDNGQPTWLIGAGTPHAGTGADAGKTVLPMNQVGIFQGRSFPIGETNASPSVWGSITITFADANTGVMNWTTNYPGFNSGTMELTHFLPVGVPAQDVAGAQVKACYSGNWKEPTKSGHGFEFEVIPSSPPTLAVDWFAYSPSGAPVWLQGAGAVSGNGATMQLQLLDGSGAQFPPLFDGTKLTQHIWGSLAVTFTDSSHAHVSWNSTIPGYGSGAIDVVPTFGLDRRNCQ